MLNKNRDFQTFLGCDKNYNEADVVIFGAGYDATTSNKPGSRFAPSLMRLESYGLETYSPALDKDLEEDAKIYDAGDLELYGRAETVLDAIEVTTAQILADGKTPFMIGGEHLVTLGGVRAALKKHPNLHIVHLDAHTDLRDDYMGEPLSHATVIKRCLDLVGNDRVYQHGIRSGTKEEFALASNLRKTLPPKDVPVYLTLDLDVLDPSAFCGTGTPEAGGLTYLELMAKLKEAMELNIVALDMVELAPNYDQSGVSTATACKVLREMLLML